MLDGHLGCDAQAEVTVAAGGLQLSQDSGVTVLSFLSPGKMTSSVGEEARVWRVKTPIGVKLTS